MGRKALVFTILFFCSGATALVYEVVWSKYLVQMFGSTVYAQTIVLAVFMGGLALGNSVFGRRADRMTNPMRVYGYVEIAIGVYAFLFSGLFNFADIIFVKVGTPALQHAWVLLLLKAILSIALMLGPTLLMGGTLPLLAGWLNTNMPEAGRRSAMFYAINCLGAVLGAALAGFYLVRNLGMLSTLQLTGMANVTIGGLAILLSTATTPGSSPVTAPSADAAGQTQHAQSLRWAGWLVAITGGISMGLEVLASRSLGMIFGSSLQSFAVVLISFILGIGLGSVWICKRRTRWNPDPSSVAAGRADIAERSGLRRVERLVLLLLLLAATWIGVLIVNIEKWVEFYRWAISGLARTDVGYTFHHLLAACVSIFLLGVPAALLGSILPLQIRSHESQSALGREVGKLLTANTLGAVAGVILCGFVLMPAFGLRNAFVLLALVLCAVAAFVAWKKQHRLELRCSAIVGSALALVLVFGGEGWRFVMSSGVFRYRDNHFGLSLARQHLRLLFYEDAADATVAVRESKSDSTDRDLSINGKPDASTRSDLSTQLLLGHLPLLAKPDSKDVFLLGLGSGITGGAAVAHPIERLTIAENCKPVVRAARLFDSWSRGVLTNPVARIWIEDARTILKLSPQRYDVIICEPSNPWTVGVGSVFSQEFYELTASRLKPGGLMVQWFHVYEMHDGIVSLVLRTFGQTFPFLEVWDTCVGDLVLIGAREPWPSGPEVFRRGFERDLVRKDLQRIGIISPEALWARQLASQRTAFAIAGDGPIQRDQFPILEYDAPKAFYIGQTSMLLCKYDERTLQADLAPADKRATLRALDDAQLKLLFAQFMSINPGLLADWRAWFQTGDTARVARAGSLLCRDVNAKPKPILEDMHPEIRELLTACNLLNSPAQTDGIDRIASLLRNRGTNSNWSAGHYAALAAKSSLALGDIPRSRTLVRLGLEVEPHHELLYLDRVLQREESLNRRQLSAVK